MESGESVNGNEHVGLIRRFEKCDYNCGPLVKKVAILVTLAQNILIRVRLYI